MLFVFPDLAHGPDIAGDELTDISIRTRHLEEAPERAVAAATARDFFDCLTIHVEADLAQRNDLADTLFDDVVAIVLAGCDPPFARLRSHYTNAITRSQFLMTGVAFAIPATAAEPAVAEEANLALWPISARPLRSVT